MHSDKLLNAALENGRCTLAINILIPFMVTHLYVLIRSHIHFHFFLVYLNDNYEVVVLDINGQAQTRLQQDPSPGWHKGLSRWI